MSKKISLTIAERYDIVKYAHQIPSNRVTYFSFPEFLEVIPITDEVQVNGIRIRHAHPQKDSAGIPAAE